MNQENRRRVADQPEGQKQRTIYDAGNEMILPGRVARREGDPPTDDVAVNEVYDALGTTYDFFWNIFERNSIDNQGMELLATVHYGVGYDNAFWTGRQSVVGDGDENLPQEERRFNRFSVSIDIIARHFVYGLNQHESKLNFSDQSGALTVSFGDVFGSLVKQYSLKQTADQADWLIGQALFTSNISGEAIRSMRAPGTAFDDPVLGKDSQPAHVQDLQIVTYDNGGVHINCGIPNHAFYTVATRLGGYAWEKAGRIWYITLHDRLRADSDFQDAANQTSRVAGELYGDGSPEQLAVRAGWDQVGITIGGGFL